MAEDQDSGRGTEVKWADGGPFAVCPRWVYTAPIGDRAVRLYLVLAGFAGLPETATFRGKADLAVLLGCAKSSIEKAIGELKAIGALTTASRYEGRVRLPNDYILHAVPHLPGDGGSPAEPGGGSPAEAGASRARVDALHKNPEKQESGADAPSAPHPPGEVQPAPPTVKINGRNLGFDALLQVCGIDPASPRTGHVVAGLNGTKKPPRPGIRALTWLEAHRWAEAEGLSEDAIEDRYKAEGGPEGFEEAVARSIRRKARLYREKMPGAMLTPTALHDYWLDLEKEGEGAGLSAAQIAALG